MCEMVHKFVTTWHYVIHIFSLGYSDYLWQIFTVFLSELLLLAQHCGDLPWTKILFYQGLSNCKQRVLIVTCSCSLFHYIILVRVYLKCLCLYSKQCCPIKILWSLQNYVYLIYVTQCCHSIVNKGIYAFIC